MYSLGFVFYPIDDGAGAETGDEPDLVLFRVEHDSGAMIDFR